MLNQNELVLITGGCSKKFINQFIIALRIFKRVIFLV